MYDALLKTPKGNNRTAFVVAVSHTPKNAVPRNPENKPVLILHFNKERVV